LIGTAQGSASDLGEAANVGVIKMDVGMIVLVRQLADSAW
jgi:hypothetical protein